MDTPIKCLNAKEDDTEGNFTIIIHMKKKMENRDNSSFLGQQQQLSASDTNNNSNLNNPVVDSEKSNSSKSESTISCGKKAFYKLIFNKSGSNSNNNNNNHNNNNNNNNSNNSSGSSDTNNNSSSQPTVAPAPPLNNSYTKVSMERTGNGTIESKLSLLSVGDQSHSQSPQGNSFITSPTSADSNRVRYNSSLDEYRLEDSDERARIRRAIEIQEGIEIETSSELIESLTSLNSRTSDDSQQPEHCKRCQLQNELQYRQMQQALLSIADDETNPKYHSQVAYCHYLVPDLEKITSCCYYWGKMDRYEAEKLLEGKPEGTFLLRDSAQDDFLFSVSFRKYGRSLHARIEQFNHKFSFDSHDPSVYMASTVTGLVEHYKDPTSVMFFEPMLTSPLHRNHVFSLQQLCRASIVSHTSYDGINKLCLPPAMKSYLKEYHYKLRVRVKQFPEGVTYKNS